MILFKMMTTGGGTGAGIFHNETFKKPGKMRK